MFRRLSAYSALSVDPDVAVIVRCAIESTAVIQSNFERWGIVRPDREECLLDPHFPRFAKQLLKKERAIPFSALWRHDAAADAAACFIKRFR